MCDCIKKIEDQMLVYLRENEKGDISSGGLLQTQYPLVNLTIQPRITYTEFQYSFAPDKKDGTIGKYKNKISSVNHSYCPFCGEKYPETK